MINCVYHHNDPSEIGVDLRGDVIHPQLRCGSGYKTNETSLP